MAELFPVEIWFHIFSFLDSATGGPTLGCACRQLWGYWKNVCDRRRWENHKTALRCLGLCYITFMRGRLLEAEKRRHRRDPILHTTCYVGSSACRCPRCVSNPISAETLNHLLEKDPLVLRPISVTTNSDSNKIECYYNLGAGTHRGQFVKNVYFTDPTSFQRISSVKVAMGCQYTHVFDQEGLLLLQSLMQVPDRRCFPFTELTNDPTGFWFAYSHNIEIRVEWHGLVVPEHPRCSVGRADPAHFAHGSAWLPFDEVFDFDRDFRVKIKGEQTIVRVKPQRVSLITHILIWLPMSLLDRLRKVEFRLTVRQELSRNELYWCQVDGLPSGWVVIPLRLDSEKDIWGIGIGIMHCDNPRLRIYLDGHHEVVKGRDIKVLCVSKNILVTGGDLFALKAFHGPWF